MEVSNETEGEMEDAPVPSSTASDSPQEEADQPANKRVTRLSQRNTREASVDMLSEETGSTSSQNAYHTPQSGTSSSSSVSASTATASATKNAKEGPPPLDEQIATILRLAQSPMSDGMKGYVMSGPWLKEAQDRGTAADKSSKQAKEEVLPAVDNRGLVLKIDGITPDLTDGNGDKFYPLKPGQEVGREIEILPEEAWDKIVKWHGLEDGSPEIVRYCHNTSSGPGSENNVFELYPPVFTVLKLPWRGDVLDMDTLREKELAPVRVVASRNERFQDFLRRSKEKAKIKQETRVRLWRIVGNVKVGQAQNGPLTPEQSRSNSPAPGAMQPVDLGNKLVLDNHTFINLQLDSQRELIQIKDETSNANYNGHVNLDVAGLGQEGVLVLEEQVGGPAGGEFVSESVKAEAAEHGLSKTAFSASSNSLKVKSNTASGRSSPAPTGMVTRGRAQRSGRTRGVVGLGNLGNTCYMNSALQCVRSVKELTSYFLEGKYKEELNPKNPLSHNGDVAKVYAALLREIYINGSSSISPRQFKQTIGRYGPSFSGYSQQDSQEFLLFLLDGLQEDLNRIYTKPYIEKPDSTDEMVHDHEALRRLADTCWDIYKARNDSVITDLFAGMYKSTLHCPVCDKTSIIFDPFNNLTLQLPIPNIWSRKIVYVPLRSRPIEIDIDIDKTSTWYGLKEHVAAKMDTDPKRLVCSEIYKNRFFKMYDDRGTLVEERMADGDIVSVFEVDQIPTNYPNAKKPVRKVRSLLDPNSEDDEEVSKEEASLAERLLVPVFSRLARDSSSRFPQRSLFGVPMYITLTREEACDQDEILRKVLGKVATLTTRDILREDGEKSEDANDDDVVVMSTEDTDSSSESKVNANSVQSEDGLVDVSMQGTEESGPRVSYPPFPRISKSVPRVLHHGEFIVPELRQLFNVSILRTTESIVPTGWSSLQDDNKKLPTLFSRVSQVTKQKKTKRQKTAGELLKNRLANNGSPDSSDDDTDNALPTVETAIGRRPSESNSLDEDDMQRNDSTDAGNNGFSRFSKNSSRDNNGRLITTYSRKGRRQKSIVAYDGTASEDERPTTKTPLVRLGEGLVLDWNSQSYDALFEGQETTVDNDFSHGTATWEHLPLLPDAELHKSRALRAAKKKRGITLDDCLNEFGKEEILSQNDAWYCPRCKEHRRASKKFELWTVPDILVVHLKRFSSEGRFRDKENTNVDFPITDLDINDRVIVKEEGRDLIYDLFAVDNHYGGLGGGHYTAYAKSFDDEQWYEYNDSMAAKVGDPEQVVSSAAYILFYRRRSSNTLGGPAFERSVHEMENPIDSNGSQNTSRNQSPSAGLATGEGRRLEDSSRGFSSASHEAGAARRAGNGGQLQDLGTRGGMGPVSNDNEGAQEDADEDDTLPSYTQNDPNPVQSMELDDMDASGPSGLSFETGNWTFESLGPGTMGSFEVNVGEDGHSITSQEGHAYGGYSRGQACTPDGDNDSMVANQEDADFEDNWEGIQSEPERNEEEVVEIQLEGKEDQLAA